MTFGAFVEEYFLCSEDYTDAKRITLTVVNLCVALLSFIGASFLVVHFLRQRNNLVISRLIFFLSLGDCGVSMSIVVSSLWLLTFNYGMFVCVALRSFVQYFQITTIFWTSFIALYLVISCFKGDKFVSERMSDCSTFSRFFLTAAFLISWGAPLVLCISLVAGHIYEREGSDGWCRARGDYAYIFWEGPLASGWLSLIIMYSLAIVTLVVRRIRGMVYAREINLMLWKTSLFIVVYFVAWGPDILVHIQQQLVPGCYIFPLNLVQVALAPAQGFLNFLVYGLTGLQIRREYHPAVLLSLLVVSPFISAPLSFYYACRWPAKHISRAVMRLYRDYVERRERLRTPNPYDIVQESVSVDEAYLSETDAYLRPLELSFGQPSPMGRAAHLSMEY